MAVPTPWVRKLAVAVLEDPPRLLIQYLRSLIFFAEFQVLKPLRFRLLMCRRYRDSGTAVYRTPPAIQPVVSPDILFASTTLSADPTPFTTPNMCP